MIDIDRLHSCLERNGPRRYGKTYTNLVLALHEADFSNDTIIITAYSADYVRQLAKMASQIALEMGFEQVSLVKPDELIVNNSKYLFRSRTRRLRGSKEPMFHDHYKNDSGDWQVIDC